MKTYEYVESTDTHVVAMVKALSLFLAPSTETGRPFRYICSDGASMAASDGASIMWTTVGRMLPAGLWRPLTSNARKVGLLADADGWKYPDWSQLTRGKSGMPKFDVPCGAGEDVASTLLCLHGKRTRAGVTCGMRYKYADRVERAANLLGVRKITVSYEADEIAGPYMFTITDGCDLDGVPCGTHILVMPITLRGDT